MNRFEALNVLGLDETASDDDVKLAYYGLEKAVSTTEYGEDPKVTGQVEGLLNRAREARSFLLNPRNKVAARQVRSYTDKRRDTPVKVSSVEEKTARLHGYERLRITLVAILGNERHRRNTSIAVLVGCIVVGFILLRYLRLMQVRIVAFIVLAAVAIAGSTILTNSQLQIRRLKPHVLALDEKILKLRKSLGLDLAEGDGKLGVVLSVPEELQANPVVQELADDAKVLAVAVAEDDNPDLCDAGDEDDNKQKEDVR